MLVEMAMGDSWGAGFEYAQLPPAEYRRRLADMTRYWPHPKWSQPGGSFIPTRPGDYTDDTQMALALAEFLLEDKPWTHWNLAGAFVSTFKRDPRPGYAGHFWELLKKMETTQDFLLMVHPTSEKSGGAMRAGPVGLLPVLGDVINRAMLQASLTHATRIGMDSAAVSALMVHYFYYRLGSKDGLGAFLDEHVPGYNWSEDYKGKVLAYGWMPVKAAVTAIRHGKSLADVLHRCVAFTGDVDTVGAIALCAASVCDELQPDLPIGLVQGLESGPFGFEHLVRIDKMLMEKFPRPEPTPVLDENPIADLFSDP